MIEVPDGGALVRLLHLCDSLFPIGSFAHSDGLEAATAQGLVTKADDLRAWLEVVLADTLQRLEGPAVCRAWRASVEGRWIDLARLDLEMHALRPSSAARNASRTMGARLLKTWHELHPAIEIERFVLAAASREATLPVAFGIVCAAARIPLRAALGGYQYTRLAATVSAAMRLMAIGQREAHALLADVLDRVPAGLDCIVASDEPPSAFTPALDVAAMSQQYIHSRLFRS